VGKTITLQLYTLIESNNYKKIYFHFSQKIKFSGINKKNKKEDVKNKDSNDVIINTENEENNEKDIETKSLDNKYHKIINIFSPIDFIGLNEIFLKQIK